MFDSFWIRLILSCAIFHYCHAVQDTFKYQSYSSVSCGHANSSEFIKLITKPPKILQISTKLINSSNSSLRTSETNYLNEAYSFYAAIRGRAYYSRACKEDRPDLMVKKLRYYARFIVVCLLLKKMKLVRELVIELERQIQEYTQTWVFTGYICLLFNLTSTYSHSTF